MKTKAEMLTNKEREAAQNTHRFYGMVLRKLFYQHAVGKAADEQIDFTTLVFLFFCSFTDKILNS